jgi:hypothetical protein
MSDFTLNILCKDAPGVLQVRPPPPASPSHLTIFFERLNVGTLQCVLLLSAARRFPVSD